MQKNRRKFTNVYTARAPRAFQPYMKLHEYAVVASIDGRSCLVHRDGSIDCLSLPRPDSSAIFCRLYDAKAGGFFEIAPIEPIQGTQMYLSDTNIARTTFVEGANEVSLTDYMPSFLNDDNGPALIRIVECRKGSMALGMSLKGTPDFARKKGETSLVGENSIVITSEDQCFILTIIGSSQVIDFSMDQVLGEGLVSTHKQVELPASDTVNAQFTLHEGMKLIFAFGSNESASDVGQLIQGWQQYDYDYVLRHSINAWRQWLSNSKYIGPYTDIVKRCLLQIKMLCYAPTGAILAAATTSLPEHIGGVRNWDYRYTWIRDSSFGASTLARYGFKAEALAFMRWLLGLKLTSASELKIMYTIDGLGDLEEEELPLEGYMGSFPVRVGNEAAKQRQLDVYGELIQCVITLFNENCFEEEELLLQEIWGLVQLLANHVCEIWLEKDQGLWEARNEPQHYVHSKVMCWLALVSASDLSVKLGGDEEQSIRWEQISRVIKKSIIAEGYDPMLRTFTQYYGASGSDAANLVMAHADCHFLPPSEQLLIDTLHYIGEHLTDALGFVYRYQGEDGLSGGEGTFTLCSLWYAEALANTDIKELVLKAEEILDLVLAYASPLGTFSEEIDAMNRTALGNLPQLFTLIGILRCILALEEALKKLA